MKSTAGLHHITAIVGDPQQNYDFYTGVLGMRMVKKSINQDVPDTYHLYFADALGTPGTNLTFFPWPDLPARRDGSGQWGEISLIIDPAGFSYWGDRLSRAGVQAGPMEWRFDERVLPFTDPHGLRLALIEAGDPPAGFHAWEASPVPVPYQIRGFGGVRLRERDAGATTSFLARSLGFAPGERDGGWTRLVVGEGGAGQRIELHADEGSDRGRWGIGAVHHVAWRAADRGEQLGYRERVVAAGGRPTDVIDRFWFESVYVKEPGGALLEIATDGPGFAVDEEPEHLGERLVLPPWFEERRDAVERALPPLTTTARSVPTSERRALRASGTTPRGASR